MKEEETEESSIEDMGLRRKDEESFANQTHKMDIQTVSQEESATERAPSPLRVCGVTKRYAMGLLMLLLTVMIWVLDSEFIQWIYDGFDYNQPFFLTYLSTALFGVYLSGFLFLPAWSCRDPDQGGRSLVNYFLDRPQPSPPLVVSDDPEDQDSAQPQIPAKPLTVWETAKISLLFCPVWFAANYFYNLSLLLTSVASSTIISSTSSLWTLVIAALFGAEKFSPIKLLSIIITIIGVVLIALTDSGDKTELAGDFVGLLSAVFYGLYVTLLKVKIKDDNRCNSAMFFGFVGVFNVLTMWPIGLILNYTGYEIFRLPDAKTMGILVLNALIGTVLSDYLWMLSVLWTSPVVATLGLTLTIPFSMIADVIIHQSTFSLMYISGSILVLFGFVVVNLDRQILSLLRRLFRLSSSV